MRPLTVLLSEDIQTVGYRRQNGPGIMVISSTIELSGSAERRFRNNVAGLSMKQTKEALSCRREKEIHESSQV
jgi:hypothetical protein